MSRLLEVHSTLCSEVLQWADNMSVCLSVCLSARSASRPANVKYRGRYSQVCCRRQAAPPAAATSFVVISPITLFLINSFLVNTNYDHVTNCSRAWQPPRATLHKHKKHLKNVEPIRHCEPPHATCTNFTLPFTRCRYCRTPPLSYAACASMSIEWAQ